MDLSKASEMENNGPSGSGSSGTNKNVNDDNGNNNNIKITAHIPIRKIYIHPVQPKLIGKIRGHFETYGEVESFVVRRKGDFRYGFVQFKSAAVVETVLLKKRLRIGRCVINVKAAFPDQQPDYESITSNPLMFPPEQDDDKHIINALNSHCFHEIFKRLDLPDLVNVAEVCTRFNEEANTTFSLSKYRQMVFTDSEFSDQPNKMKKVMRHFGEHIRSMCIKSKFLAEDFLLRAILDYCTEQLTELRLEYFHIDEESPSLRPIFAKSEKLELVDCIIDRKFNLSWDDCVKLNVLRLDSSCLEYDDESIGRTFVNLQEAHFVNTTLSCEFFQHFIVSNPTATKLSINQVFDKARALYLIGQNMPNLQELECNFKSSCQSTFRYDAPSIGQLTQLRVLKLHFNWVRAAPLMDALCMNNMPIEHLKMEAAYIDDDAVESILKMERMKVLELISAYDLTNDHLIRLAKGLHELQELQLASAADLTKVYLKKIVSYASKMKLMKLRSCGNFTIDIDDYNVMLHTVQNRQEKVSLWIGIESDGKMVNVPEETLHEHRQELFIEEKEVERDNETSSDDSDHMNDDDSWYGVDQDDFDDFSDARGDDVMQQAVKSIVELFLLAHKVYQFGN